jgi:hypothetical protein
VAFIVEKVMVGDTLEEFEDPFDARRRTGRSSGQIVMSVICRSARGRRISSLNS